MVESWKSAHWPVCRAAAARKSASVRIPVSVMRARKSGTGGIRVA